MSIVSLIPIIGQVIDKVIPDQNQAASAKQELDKLDQQGELQLMLAQIDVNKAEASNANWFVAGWRPFIGWICGFALGYEYLLLPLLSWASINIGIQSPPHLFMDGMMELVLAMLGVAGLRSVEKIKGVA